MSYPQGPNAESTIREETAQAKSEAAYETFCETFGDELRAIGEWMQAAPEGVDLEAALENAIDHMDFDASDDGERTNWEWVQDAIEAYAPRLKAARIARQSASKAEAA